MIRNQDEKIESNTRKIKKMSTGKNGKPQNKETKSVYKVHIEEILLGFKWGGSRGKMENNTCYHVRKYVTLKQ